MRHLTGLKLDAAYEYLNWHQSGWQGGFIAKQGYYSSVPETAKQFMTEDEWNYWYEGKPAQSEIKDPYGITWRMPAMCATAAPSGSAWATSPAGIPSWTRTATWFRSGMSSSPHEICRLAHRGSAPVLPIPQDAE